MEGHLVFTLQAQNYWRRFQFRTGKYWMKLSPRLILVEFLQESQYEQRKKANWTTKSILTYKIHNIYCHYWLDIWFFAAFHLLMNKDYREWYNKSYLLEGVYMLYMIFYWCILNVTSMFFFCNRQKFLSSLIIWLRLVNFSYRITFFFCLSQRNW